MGSFSSTRFSALPQPWRPIVFLRFSAQECITVFYEDPYEPSPCAGESQKNHRTGHQPAGNEGNPCTKCLKRNEGIEHGHQSPIGKEHRCHEPDYETKHHNEFHCFHLLLPFSFWFVFKTALLKRPNKKNYLYYITLFSVCQELKQ